MSKANVAGVRAHLRPHVQEILAYFNSEEHKRNFLESVELQVGLKNYDPRKDRRLYVFLPGLNEAIKLHLS